MAWASGFRARLTSKSSEVQANFGRSVHVRPVRSFWTLAPDSLSTSATGWPRSSKPKRVPGPGPTATVCFAAIPTGTGPFDTWRKEQARKSPRGSLRRGSRSLPAGLWFYLTGCLPSPKKSTVRNVLPHAPADPGYAGFEGFSPRPAESPLGRCAIIFHGRRKPVVGLLRLVRRIRRINDCSSGDRGRQRRGRRL